MKVHRFEASTMKDAMRLVRKELGADAVMMGSEANADGVILFATLPKGMAPKRVSVPLHLRGTRGNECRALSKSRATAALFGGANESGLRPWVDFCRAQKVTCARRAVGDEVTHPPALKLGGSGATP